MLRSATLSALIEEYSSEEVLPNETKANKLLVFLLRHGYIDEHYAEYINYFHPNSITKDEMNFILGIRNFEAIGDFSYPLTNCAQIIERIEVYEFKQPETLNFNLFDYMITQEVKGEKYDIFIKQIANDSEKSYKFIKAYIERGINQEIFIREICHYNHEIWLDILLDNTISEETQYKYFILILCYANVPDIKRGNDYI